MLAAFVSATFSVSASPPALVRTFNATVSGYSVATGAVNQSVSGRVIFDEAVMGQLQTQELADGRSVQVIFNYSNTSSAGVYALQPFFDEHVCMLYPLPPGYPGHSISYDLALEEAWCLQAAPCMSFLASASANGTCPVGGTRWVYTSPAGDDTTTFCVTDAGEVRYVGRDYHSNGIDIVSRATFTDYHTAVDASAFVVKHEDKCVDLRSPSSSAAAASPSALVNDPVAIARANAEADGAWHAAPSAVFEGYSVRDGASRLGLGFGEAGRRAGFGLAPPAAAHVAQRTRSVAARGGLPAAFDARTEWGAKCKSVVTIRNQGDCGGCWAFSAAETLADRTCIADAQSAAPTGAYANLTLSPEYVMDCDTTDAGCGGGLLDDAWRYLVKKGAVEEACDPYLWCAHPNSPSCEVGPHPPRPHPATQPCPATCKNGAAHKEYRAASAYAVAKPGVAEDMQSEVRVILRCRPFSSSLYLERSLFSSPLSLSLSLSLSDNIYCPSFLPSRSWFTVLSKSASKSSRIS